ncbi:MAG: alpha/beta hydrolase [Pseudomonadota bacterium]
MKKLLTTTAIITALTLTAAANVEAATKKRVTFESNNQTLVGDLYLPDDFKEGDKLPGVIVSGSWTSVKEQMAGGYAAKLADKGYAALAFDFRGWGESAKGTPTSLKFVEHPGEKTKDILAATDFMASRPEVDSRKLATLGICASTGYAIDAAHLSDTITTTATVAPWLHDKPIVDEVYGENVPALLQATADAKAGEPIILEAAGDANSDAVMQGAVYYTDPNRGAIPEYDDKFSTLSWGPWLNYDAIQTASQINDPMLLVHSEAAAIPQGAKKFATQGGENVELIMMDNVTQFDFYDQPEAMDAAVKKVDAHFQTSFQSSH